MDLELRNYGVIRVLQFKEFEIECWIDFLEITAILQFPSFSQA